MKAIHILLAVSLILLAATASAITPIKRPLTQTAPAVQPTPPPPPTMPRGAVPAAPSQQLPAVQTIQKPVQFLPAPVIDIINAASASSISVRWSWGSPAPITGFKVERKQEGGAFSVVATTSATTRVLVETTLSANTKYTYRVRAFQGGMHSPYSNEASATTQKAAMLIAPSSIKQLLNVPSTVFILSNLEVMPSGVVDYGTNLQFKATIFYSDEVTATPGTSFPCNVVKIMPPSWMSEMEGFKLPYPNTTNVINFTSTYPVTAEGPNAVQRGQNICFRIMQETVQVSNEVCVQVKKTLTPAALKNLKNVVPPSGQPEPPAKGDEKQGQGPGPKSPGSEIMFNPQPEPPAEFIPHSGQPAQ